MPVYTVDLAFRSTAHDYAALFGALRAANAQPFMQGRWLLDVREDVDAVTSALLSHCAKGDGLLVTKLDPETRWTGTGLSAETKAWLLSRMIQVVASPPTPIRLSATTLN